MELTEIPNTDNWEHCPACSSSSIEADRFDVEGKVVWQNVTCLDCETTWQEVYEAVGRDLIKVPA